LHRGYVRRCAGDEAAEWAARATFRAEGAELDVNGSRLALPLLARVAPAGDRWELPAGQRGTVVAGKVSSSSALAEEARRQNVVDWAIRRFSGAPYLWGGVTPWGVDCSGLVQTVFAARGLPLPRDSSEQEKLGSAITDGAVQPGDLYFFSESGKKVTHVAMAGHGHELVHSTLSCGGFIVEPFVPGSRAWQLKDQLVSVKRW
jgi:cell wall-associated NlpC family hydrolase